MSGDGINMPDGVARCASIRWERPASACSIWACFTSRACSAWRNHHQVSMTLLELSEQDRLRLPTAGRSCLTRRAMPRNLIIVHSNAVGTSCN